MTDMTAAEYWRRFYSHLDRAEKAEREGKLYIAVAEYSRADRCEECALEAEKRDR